MIIDCISDLHGHYPKLQGGGLLIVAGDLTARDSKEEYEKTYHWLAQQSYKKTIVIAGNHDNLFQNEEYTYGFPGSKIQYLEDSGTEFEGLKIWGSPWTKTFEGMNPHCKAFTVNTEEELEKKWCKIPIDVDILITHNPPYGILDEIDFSEGDASAFSIGSHSLLYYTRMHQPKLHVFGHVHESYGEVKDIIHYVNASHVNERYEPVNKSIRIIL